MTTQLQEFDFNWKSLNAALNKIVSAVNSNRPLPGEQISLDEKGTLGVSINVAGQAHGGDSNTQSGGQSSQTQQINELTFTGIKWMDLAVVDPASCEQTMFSVLVNTGNAGDSATLTLQSPLVEPFP